MMESQRNNTRRGTQISIYRCFLRRFWAFLLIFSCCKIVVSESAATFNYEIEKRILDRLYYYMNLAVDTNTFIANFRFSGGFPHNLQAADRDAYSILGNSLRMPLLIYYGLEDGSITGFYMGGSSSIGYYREPGNSGYDTDDAKFTKHLKSCVNKENGEPVDCIMSPGDDYVRCVDDDCNALEPCLDEESQRDCSQASNVQECESKKKYCVFHEIVQVQANETKGFIPLTNYCHDMKGLFTQTPGTIVKGYHPSTHDLGAIVASDGITQNSISLGDCMYADGVTPVQRKLAGDYAYCGGDLTTCDTTFAGGYESNEYDPRYRPWYIQTKLLQKPSWTDPFPFFDLGLGITATHPIYDILPSDDEFSLPKKVFAGVLAVDYRFEDIAEFLLGAYGSTTTLVAIYEDKDPNYLIALSTGSQANTLVLSSDPTQPCPVTFGTDIACDPKRVKFADLMSSGASTSDVDAILVKAYQEHKRAGYPKELIAVKKDDDRVDSKLYLAQSSLYEQAGANLKWRIIVASPGEHSTADSIQLETATESFAVIIIAASLGFTICCALLTAFYRKRKERAIVYSDWRFTCAFILGCALMNCSTFTLLGPNTDTLCMLRMWSYHLLFVISFAPLFVKIWRMWKLVGSTDRGRMRRIEISNVTTALCMLPMIAFQAIILLIISFVDPPVQTDETELSQGVITQHTICAHDTNALRITTITVEAGMVLLGCVLAYQTRNLDPQFGEAKQIIFAMYNIMFVGLVFLLALNLAEIDANGAKLLQAIGVFWTSIFSSAAFVIPRLVQVRTHRRMSSSGIRISGLAINPNTMESIRNAILKNDSEASEFGGSNDDKQNPSLQLMSTMSITQVNEKEEMPKIDSAGENLNRTKGMLREMIESLSSSSFSSVIQNPNTEDSKIPSNDPLGKDQESLA